MLNQNGRYCIYLRKSRADHDAGTNDAEEILSRHERILQDLANSLQTRISKTFREIVSGDSISARPLMQQLLLEVESHQWDGVFVVEIERLARGDTIDQGTVARAFQISSTKIITPLRIYDPENEADEEYFEFGLFMSRREYKTIKRRLLAGRLSSSKEGKYTGSIAPFGYDRCKLSREKGFSLSPNPEQAAVVKMVYDWYINGYQGDTCGYSKIAQHLNALNIPSAHCQSWSSDTVRCILTNPVYTGKICWNKRKQQKSMEANQLVIHRPLSSDYLLIEGLHEPIISNEIFQTAQFLRCQRNHHPVRKNDPLKNPLAGLVICSCCHQKMIRKSGNNTSSFLVCPTPGCPTIGAALELVESRILTTLISFFQKNPIFFSPPSGKETNAFSPQHQLLTVKEKELFLILSRQTQICELLELGVYSPETYRERLHDLTLKKAQCTSIISALKKDQTDFKNALQLPAKVSLSDLLLTIYPFWNPNQKNEFLKILISRISYSKYEKRKKGHENEDSFSLQIFPKIQ